VPWTGLKVGFSFLSRSSGIRRRRVNRRFLILVLGGSMPRSILDAIRAGQWDYDPETVAASQFEQTDAMPGTREKVEALAARILGGLPLWHPRDRSAYDEPSRGR
jgi:hypothetical protein